MALPVLAAQGKGLLLTLFVVSGTEAAGGVTGGEELYTRMDSTQSLTHMNLNYSVDKILDF